MKASAEVHGVELIQRLASEKIVNKNLKSRVWSDTMQCWGFFANPIAGHDVFLIIGASQIGDMLLIEQDGPFSFLTRNYEPVSEYSSKIPYVILGRRQFELNGNSYNAVELLSSSPMNVFFLAVPQRMLFESAWRF